MPMTRATADAVLKEFYLPRVRQVLNNETFLLSQIEQTSENVEGRRAVVAINTGRNNGIGARAELGILPAAGQQGYSEERIPLKYNYGRIMISGPVMASTGSDRGSFVRAVGSETEGVTRDLRNDVNRQLYNDGTGAIAAVAAVAGATTVGLQSGTPTQLRQLAPGMVVDIGTLANPTASATAALITSVSTAAGGSVTFSAAVTTTAGHFIFRTGSGGTGATQKEITGLQAQVSDTGILWNIDPAAVGQAWQSYVRNVAGPPTEDMYVEAENEVAIRSGGRINLWITTDLIHRATAKLMTSLKRFPGTTVLNGGYSALDISSAGQGSTGPNTVALYFDKDCPQGTAFGLNTDRLQFYRMSDWEFMDDDGAILCRIPGPQGQDAYEATLFLYAEMATDARNAHAKLSGIVPT